MNNIIQFSDHQKKPTTTTVAALDSGVDELGNTVINADLGPLEVSIYTSQDDGVMIVQIDSPSPEGSEKPTLRVYLNGNTLYDHITESEPDSTPEGA